MSEIIKTPKPQITKFPCGNCTIGVKYSGIKCTGPCNRWYHAGCENIRGKELSKFSKENISTWICTSCRNAAEKCQTFMATTSTSENNSLEEVKEKIQNLGACENQDLETSLTLAVEAGSLLVEENDKLKQQLCEEKLKNLHLEKEISRLNQLLSSAQELEEDLQHTKKYIQGLETSTNELQQELQHAQRKIKEETALKNDLIHQSEEDRIKIKNKAEVLEKNLKDKIKLLEYNLEQLVVKNNSLTETVQEHTKAIEGKNQTITVMKKESEELVSKFSKQETKIKTCLSSFFEDLKKAGNAFDGQKPVSARGLGIDFKPNTIEGDGQTLKIKLKQTVTEGSRQNPTKKLQLLRPPCTAQKLREGETYEEFFNRDIKRFLSLKKQNIGCECIAQSAPQATVATCKSPLIDTGETIQVKALVHKPDSNSPIIVRNRALHITEELVQNQEVPYSDDDDTETPQTRSIAGKVIRELSVNSNSGLDNNREGFNSKHFLEQAKKMKEKHKQTQSLPTRTLISSKLT